MFLGVTDRNECAISGAATCGNHSHCENTYGSYMCVHDRGYEDQAGPNGGDLF